MPAIICLLASISACGLAGQPSSAADKAAERITVAAASDLRPAFDEIAEAFEAETGVRVTLSYGSSGQLREQIVNGAPFDLFASADAAHVDAVIAAGRGDAATRAHYADGRLALVVPAGDRLPADVAGLRDPGYRRIAVANPDHAPYGVAAVQALEAAGIGDDVADRLLYGQNVADAYRLAGSAADAGLVALSLAVDDLGDDGYLVVPEALHEPLHQTLVVTGAGPAHEPASRFAAMVAGPTGRAILDRYGFEPAAGHAPRG